MKVFVSGATGFLGSHLCRRLKEQGYIVTAVNSKSCDLTKESSLKEFSSSKYDLIFHLAVWTQAGDFCLYHTGEQWLINQRINTNMLDWWQAEQPQAKMITIGTSCAYAPGKLGQEKDYFDGRPTETLFSYAMTKRMLQAGLEGMQKQFGLKFLTLVPATLYGADYHLDGRQMHFIFDLIRKILSGKRDQVPVVLWGDGYQTRELMHVDDFITAALALTPRVENEIVNIGSGVGYTIREFAQSICRIVGFDSNQIAYDTSRYVGSQDKRLDVTKLRSFLPEFSERSLETGLLETIKWFELHACPALSAG